MIKIRKNKKNNLGFSLLELVLAIAIFSLSSVAIATLLIDSGVGTRLSQERVEALSYAKEGFEAVRSIRNANWADLTVGSHGLDDSSGWAFSGESDTIDNKYLRSINVTAADDFTKNISISISWDLTPSRQANVLLNTILTDWVVATTTTP